MGIARVLLQQVIGTTPARRAPHRVSLQTETGNTPALTLYTAAGFQPVTGLELLSVDLARDRQDPRARSSAYFYASAGPGQAPRHEGDHGPVDGCFAMGGEAFVVAGGSEAHPAADYGFMYQRQLTDPDGNILESGYMDRSPLSGAPRPS